MVGDPRWVQQDEPVGDGAGHVLSEPSGARSRWSLVAPSEPVAATVAAWSTSAEEARRWVSRAEHPFPADVVAGWWGEDGVHARVLLDPRGVPVAYGEAWDDPEEDEVELARLVVDPARRREGVGRRLVDGLVEVARGLDRGACVLRVVPDNAAARALYAAAGFVEVDATTAEEWNEGQPVAYVWMSHPDVG